MYRRLAYLSAVLLLALILFSIAMSSVVYIVDERQQAVVLQFGRPVKERTEPGLYYKIPLMQSVIVLPETRQFWAGEPLPDLPTKDDKKIEVEPWAMWRISDPTLFVQRMRTMDNAQTRVAQFTRGAMRDVITQYDLAELVRSSDRELFTSSSQVGDKDLVEGADAVTAPPAQGRRVRMNIKFGREEILKRIKKEASRRLAGETSSADAGAPQTSADRGIELIDLGISHIEFVESVRIKTFDRWIAERNALSAKNEFEGERMKQEMVNKATAEVQRIVGEGQRTANETKGQVDAQIIAKYAESITEMGDFYTFIRTLEVYENSISSNTKLILTTDNDILGLIKSLDGQSLQSKSADPADAGP